MNQNNNKTLKNELEDLQYELSIVLEAMLLYAGVKREKLENAIEAYIDNIDNDLKNILQILVKYAYKVKKYYLNRIMLEYVSNKFLSNALNLRLL